MANLELLEDAVYQIDEAINAVMALGKLYGADVDCLRDMRAQYKAQIDEINAQREAEYDSDEAALTREYYMSR